MRLAGYTIESVIARGGMGIVYRARHGELGRLVALKVIAAERADDPVFRERFVREARLAASLDHPNVIPIFEAGDDAGVLFIAMRLVGGGDLARLIAREGRLEPQLAVRLVEQAAAGLDAAHARGLVHRDVKPANLLLAGPPWHVYVSDFGAAKGLDGERPTTDPAAWIGTAGYAAPEQMRGGPVDGRADVFALGRVLEQALGGAPQAGELGAVVARAQAERPDDRYASAGALAAAARAALGGAPADALDAPARAALGGTPAAGLDAAARAAPGVAPAGTPDATPGEAPAGTLGAAARAAPGEAPAGDATPRAAPGEAPAGDATPRIAPGEAPADTPDATAGAALGAAPAQAPVEPTLPAPTRAGDARQRGGMARSAGGSAPTPAGDGRRRRAVGQVASGRGPSRSETARRWAIPGLLAAVVAAVLGVALAGGGSAGHRPATHRTPPVAAALPPASSTGDAVICRPASCTQAGRAVAAPIEGGSCDRGVGAKWARIDSGAPEPALICLPADNPPAGTSSPPLPTLTGARLDRAETVLDRLGIGHDTSGGGLFGIIDASNWTVCATSPPAGTIVPAGARARLFVARSC